MSVKANQGMSGQSRHVRSVEACQVSQGVSGQSGHVSRGESADLLTSSVGGGVDVGWWWGMLVSVVLVLVLEVAVGGGGGGGGGDGIRCGAGGGVNCGATVLVVFFVSVLGVGVFVSVFCVNYYGGP